MPRSFSRRAASGALAFLLLLPAFAAERFGVRPARKYAAHQRQGEVEIAVKPYRTKKDLKIAFGKVNPYKYGILPVLVVIDNSSDHAMELKHLKVRFITSDRQGIEPLSAEELRYFRPSSSPTERPRYIPQVPGLSRPKVKKGPLAKSVLAEREFKAPVIAPQSSAAGFFYYNTGADPDPIPGGGLYISGIRDLTTGKDLFYFEISTDAYKGK